MKQAFFLISIFTILSFKCLAQSDSTEQKIDRAFVLLLKNEKEKSSSGSKKSCRKTKSFQLANNPSEKKYDCIIYTKNVKLLKDKGILINSILPTFVTATATLNQIKEMAAMPEVSYIETPGINKANNESK